MTRKPVGGLSAVRLVPVRGVASVVLAGTRCTGLELASGVRPLDCPLLDDGSSYTEESLGQQGLASVRHTLTLVLGRGEGRDLAGGELLAAWVREGVVALLTTADGERMLAGWSEHFGPEQPLRLVSQTSRTGTDPLDRPTAVWVFASEDTSPAFTCENDFER